MVQFESLGHLKLGTARGVHCQKQYTVPIEGNGHFKSWESCVFLVIERNHILVWHVFLYKSSSKVVPSVCQWCIPPSWELKVSHSLFLFQQSYVQPRSVLVNHSERKTNPFLPSLPLIYVKRVFFSSAMWYDYISTLRYVDSINHRFLPRLNTNSIFEVDVAAKIARLLGGPCQGRSPAKDV